MCPSGCFVNATEDRRLLTILTEYYTGMRHDNAVKRKIIFVEDAYIFGKVNLGNEVPNYAIHPLLDELQVLKSPHHPNGMQEIITVYLSAGMI
jgi:hypothetical protein